MTASRPGLSPASLAPASLAFIPHPHRDQVVQEVHARPFEPITTPCRVLHFAFMTDSVEAEADRRALTAFCHAQAATPPDESAKYYAGTIAGTPVRWERHSEFTTYGWHFTAAPAPASGEGLFTTPAGPLAALMAALPQPGPHIVSVDLHLVTVADAPDLDQFFDRSSLCVMNVSQGAATVATDFKADEAGFVRILVVNRDLSAMAAGALVQRLLELETYRLLALLGLPEAQRRGASVARIEAALVAVTREMTVAEGVDDSQRLLDQLAALAAELEAGAAESLFRFGATRAYDSIVQGRLAAIRWEPVATRESVGSFLSRRLTPAIRTCTALEARQENLSRKLARAAQLLRTKVDIGLERQNRDILSTLSERTATQLRLQHTVEGLSIVAVSYYVVGLVGHLVEPLRDWGLGLSPEMATALAVPAVVAVVAIIVARRLKRHGGHV